jgi:hypothetical protein
LVFLFLRMQKVTMSNPSLDLCLTSFITAMITSTLPLLYLMTMMLSF